MSTAPAFQSTLHPLTYNDLNSAVTGNAAALRIITELQPSGGSGSKVFPPTYSEGTYAREKRIVDGRSIDCVLLDSVQSQANRLEQALLRAYEEAQITLPVLGVDFSAEFPDIGCVTTLDAPHRIADAIFRDSILHQNGKPVPFRETKEGKAFQLANQRAATPLFELCPTALIFGCWDSTGSQGGLGNKFARALVSEIVGFDALYGTKTSSRLDPLSIKKIEVYKAGDGWTADAEKADKDENNNPIKYVGRSGKGNPSALNHGNVLPTISEKDKEGYFVAGGVTISKAVQTTVLSLPALRRLRFPDAKGKYSPERDCAARTVLAALALTAVALLSDQGYDLRSRCLLLPTNQPLICEIVISASPGPLSQVNSKECIAALNHALEVAQQHGLQWPPKRLVLQPQPRLIELIRKSRAAETAEGEANAGAGN